VSRLGTLALLALAACSAPLPHPTARDAAQARVRWPGATLDSLEAGRRLFVFRCSGCHRLHRPEERSPAAWPDVLDDMEREARVTPEERALIEQFLVTASAEAPALARGDR
jgi:hypothetical protein